MSCISGTHPVARSIEIVRKTRCGPLDSIKAMSLNNLKMLERFSSWLSLSFNLSDQRDQSAGQIRSCWKLQAVPKLCLLSSTRLSTLGL